jgi:hypothetical protein
MKMKLMPKDIIFQFVDEVSSGTIRNSVSTGGIILAGDQLDQQQKARWGIVIGKGDSVSNDIVVGEYILIEPLMWSRGFTFDSDVKFWRTAEEKVIAVSSEKISEI